MSGHDCGVCALVHLRVPDEDVSEFADGLGWNCGLRSEDQPYDYIIICTAITNNKQYDDENSL